MTFHEFCDHCPGCRPAFFDVASGRRLPDDHAMVVKANKVWNTETTYAERKAFINVTMHNSRVPEDMRLAQACMHKLSGQ